MNASSELRSVPSIGPVTAAAFVATIDDVQRFAHAHHLEADLGLVPRACSSGDTQRVRATSDDDNVARIRLISEMGPEFL